MRLRPGHEQFNRGVLKYGARREPGFGRHAQRRNAVDVFAIDTQRFAAGCNDGRLGTEVDNRFRQPGHCIDDMLAIVEDEQQLPRTDGARDGFR